MKRQLIEFASVRFGVQAKALDKGPVAYVQSSAIGTNGTVDPDYTRRISPEGISFKPDDLLLSNDVLLIGKGNENRAVVWPGSDEDTLASSTLYVIRTDPKQVLPAYLASYLNSTPAKAYFAFHQKAGTVKVLGRAALNELMVPVPPLEHQERIVQLAASIQRSQHILADLTNANAQLLNSVWARTDQP